MHRWGATSPERARQETPGAFKPLEAMKVIDQVIVRGAAAYKFSVAATKLEDGSYAFAKVFNWNLGPFRSGTKAALPKALREA